jgi:subtilisin family serine protease
MGTNTASHGSPDLDSLFGRPQPGLSGRVPVTVALPEPDRPAPCGDRRAVVAVLDTGISTHPWLPYVELGDPGAADAVVLVDPPLQASIELNALLEPTPRVPIIGYRDLPYVEEPLLGDLSTHTGHGTFIAGLVRQLAPAAQVYAIRVMHPDGFAHEADVLFALAYLATGTQPVDVVSLSLGYFHESPAEVAVTTQIAPLLALLAEAGVTIIMAAGNYSTSRPFYPAALAAQPLPVKAAPMVSVGALNPNTTTARFSDEADWVTCYASGVAIVSTFPAAAGAEDPMATAGHREEFDPDDFSAGFAIWSGTSFAAPVVAACLADRLTVAATVDERIDAACQALDAVRLDKTITISGTR